jgi:hypothetical protein
MMRYGQEQQENHEIAAIAQQYGDDYDEMGKAIIARFPHRADVVGGIQTALKDGAAKHLAMTVEARAKLQSRLAELQGADATTWEPVTQDIVKEFPQLSPLFAGRPYSPELQQQIVGIGQSQDQWLDAQGKAAQSLLDGKKQEGAARLIVAADTPAKQTELQGLLAQAGWKKFLGVMPDAASAQAYLDRQKKDDPTSDTSWQLKETMVGGKRSWVWANPKTQEVKPADPGLGAPIPPASLIVQNQNAGAVAASVPGQMRTTLSGKRYIDLGDFGTPKEQAAARAAAEKAGIMAVDKQTGASLKALDTAKQNAMSIWNDIKAKLPKDAQGRITAAAGNRLSAYFQTDADLAAFGSWRTAAIQQVQALAEPGMGLRINQAEIKQAMENDIPQITDTVATAAQRIKNLMTMLNHKENDALTRNRSSLVKGPSTAPKANPFLKK